MSLRIALGARSSKNSHSVAACINGLDAPPRDAAALRFGDRLRRALLAAVVLAPVLIALQLVTPGLTASAAADVCLGDPHNRKCLGADDPPPPAPPCPLDPPAGYQCTPGPSKSFTFVAENPHAPVDEQVTQCAVLLEGATPPDDWGNPIVQFRGTNKCDRPIRSVKIQAHLYNQDLQTLKSSGPLQECHRFTTPSCGLDPLASRGGSSGADLATYVLRVYVRLVLEEGQPGDPWIAVEGLPANGPGSCAPGDYDVECHLDLEIPVAYTFPSTPAAW